MGSLGSFLKEKLSKSGQAEPACRSCGCCCEEFGAFLRASPADLERWQELGREDLLAHAGETGWLWLDPETGQRLPRCPYIKRISEEQAVCAIHAIKPDICRAYPSEAVGRQCARGVYFPVSLWSKKQSVSAEADG